MHQGKHTWEKYFNTFYGSGSTTINHKNNAMNLSWKKTTNQFCKFFQMDLEKVSLNQGNPHMIFMWIFQFAPGSS